MFTGLIEEVGTVSSIREREHSKQLQIVALLPILLLVYWVILGG